MAQGQSNSGNHEQHVEAGKQSSGNPNPSRQAQKKGGENSHSGENSKSE